MFTGVMRGDKENEIRERGEQVFVLFVYCRRWAGGEDGAKKGMARGAKDSTDLPMCFASLLVTESLYMCAFEPLVCKVRRRVRERKRGARREL